MVVKVVIIGGGVGGLALANSLQHAGVEYTLIEKRNTLDARIGASIGILPNGARILDQLGCYDDLEKATVSMNNDRGYAEDGSMIGESSDTLKLMERRTGYPIFFLERQVLLQTLADHIYDCDRIMLGVAVEKIDQFPDGAVVTLSDGSTLQGDIVVGADGVYSVARREMWRCADLKGEGSTFHLDKRALSAEYKCLFGVSHSVPGMPSGESFRTFAKNMSTLTYVGKAGKIFWFVFMKMDDVYEAPNIPRFTEADTNDLVAVIGRFPIHKPANISLKDLFEAREACSLVAIEEGEYQHWSHGRIVCLGDAIHKMTPNLGAGASSAIESAATLSNVIVRLAKESEKPSPSAIGLAFQKYQDDRVLRATRAARFSNKLTRMQALQSKKDYIFTHYIAPRSSLSVAEMFSDFVIGATIVDHLPVPTRSVQGTMPFNPKQGWGYEDSLFHRSLQGLPLLTLICLYVVENFTKYSLAGSNGQNSFLRFDGSASLLSEATYFVWLLEGARLKNKGTMIQFPIVFGMASVAFGLRIVAPIYFLALYMNSSIQSFRAGDNRLTDTRYSSTAALPIFLCSILPEFAATYWTTAEGEMARQWIAGWKPFLISVSHFLLARCIGPDPTPHDRLYSVKRDIPWIRFGVATLAAILGMMHIFGIFHAVMATDRAAASFASALLQSTIYEHTDFLTLCAMVWLLLSFIDLKRAGMINSSLLIFPFYYTIVSTLFGSSVTLIIGWLWREEILSSRWHRDAVVSI